MYNIREVKIMKNIIPFLTSSTSNGEDADNSASLGQLLEIFKKPAFYIVVGVIVLLIVVVYIFRRFIKVAPNTATVVKNGSNTKILLESNKRYFLKPFIEKVAVTLPLYEQETESDQLFINDGPDKLYKVRYDMKFKVVDAEKFYPFYNNFNKFFENTINEKLRAYSEEKSAAFIIKDFSKNKADIVNYLNEVLKENAIEIIDMKIKAIEPVGVRVE